MNGDCMTDTNEDQSLLMDITQLSIEQQKAIALVLEGLTDREIAEQIGVSRPTVTNWRNTNAKFIAILKFERWLLWESSMERLRTLAGKSVEVVEKAVEDNNLQAALAVLKMLDFKIKPPEMPLGIRPDDERVKNRIPSRAEILMIRHQYLGTPLPEDFDPEEEVKKKGLTAETAEWIRREILGVRQDKSNGNGNGNGQIIDCTNEEEDIVSQTTIHKIRTLYGLE